MEQNEMIAIVEQHRKAGGAGDVEGADFCRYLTADFRTESEEPLHRIFDGDIMVPEQTTAGSVFGEFLGLAGTDRRSVSTFSTSSPSATGS
jgi:hypothetical protein